MVSSSSAVEKTAEIDSMKKRVSCKYCGRQFLYREWYRRHVRKHEVAAGGEFLNVEEAEPDKDGSPISIRTIDLPSGMKVSKIVIEVIRDETG